MNNYPRSHLRIAFFSTLALVVVIATFPVGKNQALPTRPVSLEVSEADIGTATALREIPVAVGSPVGGSPVESAPTENENPERLPADAELPWTLVKVKAGDNLARIFQRLDLSSTDLHNIMSIGAKVRSLEKILPGQELSFRLARDGGFRAIRYRHDAFKTLLVEKTGDRFEATWELAEPETIITFDTAEITADNPSLFHAGKDAGLSDYIIMELANIFQWDISFALDLRHGDSFSLMYEEIHVEGEKVKEGKIVAAQFTNTGKTYSAVKYTDRRGDVDYYTPEGRSMRKAFIRDPVHFTHVSSSFNLRRLHPIHKRVMPHRGIDYAARRGTPVIASGDGKVTTRTRNEASGRYIVIQHGEQYTTKYLHLNSFAKGIRRGATVKQGQVIGYVGSSGWATAPHLHYEFLVNGFHRNPKTVKLPKAAPIPKGELARFKAAVSPTLAQLEAIAGAQRYAAAEKASRQAGE